MYWEEDFPPAKEKGRDQLEERRKIVIHRMEKII